MVILLQRSYISNPYSHLDIKRYILYYFFALVKHYNNILPLHNTVPIFVRK